MPPNKLIDHKAIGQRMRQERERLGLSREEFAEILELSDYYVGQLERGERQMSLPVLVRVSNCLHLSLDALVLGDEENQAYCIKDGQLSYAADSPDSALTKDQLKRQEIDQLIAHCDERELELVKKLLQTVLPYMRT